MDIIEESLKTCSDHLNESLDILPISDGQSEIEDLGALTIKCKVLNEKLHKLKLFEGSGDTSKLLKRLETTLEKPKETVLDRTKTLKV